MLKKKRGDEIADGELDDDEDQAPDFSLEKDEN